MKTIFLSLSLFSTLFLFSCKEGNESPAEKELDPGPGVIGVDSAKYINSRNDDSVARITPSKITE